jgi:hypothetical protein
MDCEPFYDLELAYREIAWGDLALVEAFYSRPARMPG